jgi:transposase
VFAEHDQEEDHQNHHPDVAALIRAKLASSQAARHVSVEDGGTAMPWTSRTTVDARREFVLLAKSPNANIRALCRRFNVSPSTAYKVLNRFRAMGEKGLQDLSRRPLRTPAKTPESIEQAVLSVCARNPLWGARKIARELRSQGMMKVPAPSTITNLLSRRGLLCPNKQLDALEWITASPKATPTLPEVPALIDQPDVSIVLDHLLSKRVLERRRALVILSKWRGLRPSLVCNLLRLAPSTYRRCLRVFSEGGAAALFARRKNPHRKYDDEVIKDALFEILHQPPSNFGINRTTWKMEDLSRVLKEKGKPAGEDVIRVIIKSTGYRWRKARVVLNSSDPEFSEKVSRIQQILANLAQDEAFFSIDEYGPFAVKDQPGRSLVAPGEQRLVQQWQRSRGSVTLTAAIELPSNQVSHLYCESKNTAEMVRMMNFLISKYSDRKRIYLSWDAASWHISKELNKKIDEHNSTGIGPIVATAPLPARAQFLNVIESVFSGMARAVIHNSNYKTADEARAAIDRYFDERNKHFREHPRRAGNKIWGKERVPPEFSQSNNCKDPRLG